VVAVAGTLALAGCRQLNKIVGPKPNSDLLEAELRTREREVLELRAENQHLRQLSDAYGRQGVCPPDGFITGPVLGSPGGTTLVRDLTLGTGTGGRDDDGRPGDESLQVVIVPKDDDGTAVKVPGRVTVAVAEITREGLKVPIGKWEVTPEQLKKTWKGGFLGSGYFVPLQWDRPPATDKVRVTVRFVTADGRQYEADKDATVQPLPGLAPRSAGPLPVEVAPTVIVPQPPSAALPPPEFPSNSTLLPPPRVVDDAPVRVKPAVPR
jgi:hypothetical protein